jgi:hypothetical protein
MVRDAARQRLVLGQIEVAEMCNELVAIPKLLDLLAIEGAILSIDIKSYIMRVDSRLESPDRTLPLVGKWSRCFLRSSVVIGV